MMQAIKRKMNFQKKNQTLDSKNCKEEDENPFEDILPSDFFRMFVKFIFTFNLASSIFQGMYLFKYSGILLDNCLYVIMATSTSIFFNIFIQFMTTLEIFNNAKSVFHLKDELDAMLVCITLTFSQLLILTIPTSVYYLTSNENAIYMQKNIPELWTVISLQTITFWLLLGAFSNIIFTFLTIVHLSTKKNPIFFF